MNQTQRKYFIERVREIARAKRHEIQALRDKKAEGIKRPLQRALDYLNKHPKVVADQLLEIAKGCLVEDAPFNKIELNTYHEKGYNTPAFFTSCYEAYRKDISELDSWQDAKRAKVDIEERNLIDKAYFEELPKEFLKLLEKFEALKV